MRNRLSADFFFSKFHPRGNLTLETIFVRLPRVGGSAEDEQIDPTAFDLALAYGTGPAQLRKSFIVVRDEEPFAFEVPQNIEESETQGLLRSTATDKNSASAASFDVPSAEISAFSDYQKKVVPWQQLLQADLDLTRIQHQTKSRHDVVVVASLIDRLPNLAGLCRTCEIFNAGKLVLNDLHVLEDAAFKSISVTAEKWVPIEQVRDKDLPGYLQEQRLAGYRLVGVEQTHNSQSLFDYVFPSKFVLLLGREREGIPVELLSLLDDSVEIPQFGMIRSLNVHVSGAILLYEMNRQRALRRSATAEKTRPRFSVLPTC